MYQQEASSNHVYSLEICRASLNKLGEFLSCHCLILQVISVMESDVLRSDEPKFWWKLFFHPVEWLKLYAKRTVEENEGITLMGLLLPNKWLAVVMKNFNRSDHRKSWRNAWQSQGRKFKCCEKSQTHWLLTREMLWHRSNAYSDDVIKWLTSFCQLSSEEYLTI